MLNVLLGPELGPDLYRLNSQLREDTLKEYRARVDGSLSHFVPWICAFPKLDKVAIDRILLREPTAERGGLVTDSAYLSAARHFMEPLTWLTANGIYDQRHTDWIADTMVSPQQAAVFAEGRATLMKASPFFARTYMEFIDFVVPLPGQRNRGYVTHATRGIIFRTIPDDADKYDVAIDLAHELGHSALFVLQSIDPIIASDRQKMIYSQIRRTLRPAIQTFHAAVALAYMLQFVNSMPNDPHCQAAGVRRGKKYTESLSKSLWLSLESLDHECDYSDLGRQLMREMRALC